MDVAADEAVDVAVPEVALPDPTKAALHRQRTRSKHLSPRWLPLGLVPPTRLLELTLS